MKHNYRGMFLLLWVCITLGLCSCTPEVAQETEATAVQTEAQTTETETEKTTAGDLNPYFAVHYIDVGQGDAALVICDGKTMLIDGGRPRASSIIYTYLKNLNIDRLDYIVASHADDDHIGGLSAPLAKMKVDAVLAPHTEADTRSWQSLAAKTAEQGLSVTHPKAGEHLAFGSSDIAFYGPITEDDSDRNNGSIVMKITYGETSFLFTGDAEREEEQQILNAGFDLSATVLKVGHHGSKNSTTYPFLRAIMPKYAIISVGENSYGHPTEDTLSRLRDAGAKIYRTDMQGDIIAASDGKTVTVTTKKNGDIATNPTEEEKAAAAKSAEAKNAGTDSAGNETKAYRYIGNKNTKKLHNPSCSAVLQMKEESKVYLNCTRDAAIKNGYRPCGRCIGK